MYFKIFLKNEFVESNKNVRCIVELQFFWITSTKLFSTKVKIYLSEVWISCSIY
jgi:hypothetical protein